MFRLSENYKTWLKTITKLKILKSILTCRRKDLLLFMNMRGQYILQTDNTDVISTPTEFFMKIIKLILKFICNCKIPRTARTVLRSSREGSRTSDVNTYYKAMQWRQYGICKDRHRNGRTELGSRHIHVSTAKWFSTRCQNHSMEERIVFSTSRAKSKGSYKKKNELNSYILTSCYTTF